MVRGACYTGAQRFKGENVRKMVESEQTAAVGRDRDPKKKIRFHYLKSPAFRTIHADGVFGGVTNRLNISATFYNERQPIPDQVVHSVTDAGELGAEIRDERIVRDGMVREAEANIVMDVNFAKSLVDWLQAKIKYIEDRVEEAVKEDEPKQAKAESQ